MTVGILDARTKLGAVLAPVLETDPPVHITMLDALVPPCILIHWRTPMIEWTARQTACVATGHLGLTLVGARVEVVGGVEAIEQMYDSVQRRLRADSEGWVPSFDEGITPMTFGQAQYLGVRIDVRVPLSL